ncbi:MAG: ABC transporter substrate-binding protein [Deltaproteobacteria bacterium]|jgi:iron complex transport system substrate-binding protein|nr:ABC transporter substrate-binding protein [Deltaproteobacteria bacterium]
MRAQAAKAETRSAQAAGDKGSSPKAAAAILILALALCFSALPASAADKPAIISLYAANTEILLRIGARGNLVGISRQETYDGPETIGWERPEAFSMHDDVEKFLAAAPDIVLLRPMHLAAKPDLFQTLERSGIRLWVKQVTVASDLDDYWRELGDLAGKKEEAERMIADFQKAVAKHAQSPPEKRPGVFMESIHQEVKTFTPESIPVWLMTLAGGRNVAADAKPARPGLVVADYGPERLLEKAEEIDVFISQEGQMNSVATESILSRPIYQTIAAFKNGRVYRVPEQLISRPTPSLLEGLDLLSKQIRGEVPGASPAP